MLTPGILNLMIKLLEEAGLDGPVLGTEDDGVLSVYLGQPLSRADLEAAYEQLEEERAYLESGAVLGVDLDQALVQSLEKDMRAPASAMEEWRTAATELAEHHMARSLEQKALSQASAKAGVKDGELACSSSTSCGCWTPLQVQLIGLECTAD